MITHDHNMRGKKHNGNVSNDNDPITNAKLEKTLLITLTSVQAL